MNDSEIKKAENVSDIPPQEQTDPTFFAEIVKSHLPEETIKEKIGSLKEAKGQRVEPVKTATDQEKIDAYDNLKKKPGEVQEEINQLEEKKNQTETELNNDYACRPTLDKYAEQNQQLAEAQSKITECQKEIEDLCRTIDQYLENERTKRYVLVEPVVNFEQAQTRIAKLLEETGQK
ncbi:30865_t:CDS:2 [Racocetra persica]|uniref:30865_t:CDS:1 n=1 Tax=Racocetra persica TaxID=160502 RepID=A0ACA9LFM1_9GLOM|nr:30865_t:CDS:2 [Racocetra persica]